MKPIKWNKAEREMLCSQLRDGVPIERVKIPRRKREGIRRQALKLCLIEKTRHRAPTKEDLLLLQFLREQGFNAKEIAEMGVLHTPRRTANAIQKYFSHMGLVDPIRSTATKNRKVWQNGELQRFEQFLVQNSKKIPPRQIAKKFGVAMTTVDQHQRKLGVKSTFAETMATPFMKRHVRKFLQERSKKVILRFEEHIAQREKLLEELAEILRSKKASRPEDRRCKKCGKIWLKHRKFFFHAEVKMPKRSVWYFTRICVICEARNRHKKRMPRYRRKYAI